MTRSSGIRDFTHGNIPKQLIVFAMPLFLSNLLQVVYNMVDMIVVGNTLGQVGLSAVSVGGDVSNFMTFIAMGYSSAGQVLISQYIGAKQRDRLGRFVSTMFTFMMICAVCLFLRSPILRLMNVPEVAAVISLAVWMFPEQVFSIFTQDRDVLVIANEYIPVAVLLFFGSACRAGMNALINGSGNYKINFVTAILDGIILRIGLSVLFGLVLDMKYLGFWLGDALAGFTPFWIGLVFYFTGLWKKGRSGKA